MTYLLDTNTCIQFINSRDTSVHRKLSAVRREEVFICQIVKAELLYGAYKSTRRDANLALLVKFFHEFVSLPFDDASTEVYGRLRAELKQIGKPIGPNDLILAAIAIAHAATLVSHNLREFSRVSGLRCEDWEQS